MGRARARRWTLSSSFFCQLALVAAAALAIRVAYVLVVMPHVELGFDSVWYGLQAGTIADAKGYVDPGVYFGFRGAVATANFPPLWPSLLAVVHKLGGHTQRAYELTGACLGTGTVALAGVLGRRIAGAKVGLGAAALVAASPFLVAADGSLMAETLFVLLITAAVLLAYAASDNPVPVRWLALGVVLGLAALTRSDGFVLGPLLIAVVVWRVCATRGVRQLTLGVLAIGAMALVLVPWTIRNNAALGDPIVLSSNSGSLLEGANCDLAYGGAELGRWDARCLHFTRRRGLSEPDSSRKARDRGIRYARHHLGRLPLVATVRALRIWGLYDPIKQSRAEAIESRRPSWQVLGWMYSIVVLPFAVAGALRLRRRRRDFGPLLAVIGGVTLLSVLSWGNQRFRLPAEPIVLVLATVGLQAAFGALARGRAGEGEPPVRVPQR